MRSQDTAATPLSDSRVLVICGARVLLFATFMSVAATVPLIKRDWELSAAGAGAVVSSFTIGYAVSLFLFAWGADHYGAKRMVLISAPMAGASSLAFGLFARDWPSAMVLYGLVGLAQGGVYTPLVMLLADEVEAVGWAAPWAGSSPRHPWATQPRSQLPESASPSAGGRWPSS